MSANALPRRLLRLSLVISLPILALALILLPPRIAHAGGEVTDCSNDTDLHAKQIKELISLKLSLVGLAGFEDFYPSEISGGMRKRAGLARAMALDPEILFFDEPSAGLDPISAHLLDELILELRDSLGATIVIVTHELASIFAIGNNSVFLDTESRTMIASGDPNQLLAEDHDPRIQTFLRRGELEGDGIKIVNNDSDTSSLVGIIKPDKDDKCK